ncbi:phosphoserine phosphatase SerB [Microvirga arsenatis]|uniref:Phosphoserine phosphatase n=1 Tax=Microvirga arsenatis TaxID=2692265 RepID=A0ABW9Z073_9HYPH|nr:phosphoserine phosphatase SerB [Microvirga arsenatis]NBJ11952.1 phosphoserine phosphatase SerB [Microvirga arsenatis]NBJ24064.1 phosphoserine phosphatase SerB [Microvirga arsenatis]
MASSPNSLVATLIANPSQPAVTEEVIALAARALGQETEQAVLARGIAADLIPPGAPDATAVDAALRGVLAGRPIDIVVQPQATRRKRLFLADMDSTMIGQECIDELAAYVGLKTEVSEITERAMRGEIAFEPALRERVALLKNLPVSVVDEIIEKRITLTPGGTALVRTMRANGAYTCLVSGGFTLFTGPIGSKIGFDEHRSNRLIVDGERLSGQVEEPILGREAKLATLIELRDRFGLAPHETMAVGDGANDLAMLGEAGLGVAFHAKPAVAAAAHARIDHADLSALLYCQGYHAEEIVLD